MRTHFDDYRDRYEHVSFVREDGILQMSLHTDGGPLIWGDGPHTELGSCFEDVAKDVENRVVILTGTGDTFMSKVDKSWAGEMTPAKWDKIYFNGKRLLINLLAIEVPVIAVVNGPARVHAELAVLSDITVAADTAVFQDAPHFRVGTIPGDGVHLVWQRILGPNRGRYFLMMGQRIEAEEALRLGVVNEVVPAADALARGWEIAQQLATQSDTTLRYTRVALTQELKKMMLDGVGYGLALEGLNAYATWPRE
ncbi:enoyl-CoA hydratase/isomerase family protein [Nocardioides hungaricus]